MNLPSPSSAGAVVSITNLSRQFGAKKALDDVTLHVPRGSVFGLVGQNGAGKTTLIKHILGLLKAQAGQVRVFGRDPATDPVGVLGRIGYLSEYRALAGSPSKLAAPISPSHPHHHDQQRARSDPVGAATRRKRDS